MHRTRNDIAKAQRAYIWTAAIASRYLTRVGSVGVGLRNILDGPSSTSPDLTDGVRTSIQTCLNTARKASTKRCNTMILQVITHGISSSLSLISGFGPRCYIKILTQLANHAFSVKRGESYHCMNSVRHPHNRAAHHAYLLGDNHEAHCTPPGNPRATKY